MVKERATRRRERSALVALIVIFVLLSSLLFSSSLSLCVFLFLLLNQIWDRGMDGLRWFYKAGDGTNTIHRTKREGTRF
jgi:hypothetical protein